MANILAFSEGLQLGKDQKYKNTLAELSIANEAQKLKVAQATVAIQDKTLAQLSQMSSSMGKGSDAAVSPGGIETPGSDAIADVLDETGLAYLSMGYPEKAKEFLTASGTVRNNAANVADKQTELEIKRANAAASIFASVTDQKTWEQANQVFELQMQIPSKYKKLPYTPELVDQIQQGIVGIKDRALTKAAQARQKDTETDTKEGNMRIKLLEAQVENTKQRTEHLKKTGAAVTMEPKAEDLRVITDLMMTEFGASLIPEESRVRARPIAERMLQLVKERKMTKAQAAQEAYEEAKAAGDLGGLRKRAPRQGAENNPIPLPMTKAGVLDRAAMLDNRWYNYKGTPMLLMGGKLYSREELGDEDDSGVEEE